MSQASIQHESQNIQSNDHDELIHNQDHLISQNIQEQTHHNNEIIGQNAKNQHVEQGSHNIIQDVSIFDEKQGGQSVPLISRVEQDEQEDDLKQNSIQYFDEKDQLHYNQPLTQRSQVLNSQQIHKQQDQSSPSSNQESAEKKVEQDSDVHLSGHVLSQQDRELILKQNNNAKVVINGKKNIKEIQTNMVTPKKRLSIQRLSAQKNLSNEESAEKQLFLINDPNDITKNTNSNEKNEQMQNSELIKLRLQNDKLREELKSLSDKLSIVIEKNQKNIVSSKNRLNNQTSDPVLKQELNNAYKLIDAIQRDNKKLQSQVYEGGHFEKVMKLENDLKSKDQEIKLVKKELELTKKLQKINASQESDKKDVIARKEDFNEKYVLKQKIKELQDKLSEQEDKFSKQYREFLSMEKEYKKLCERNNIRPNFSYNEQENVFERQSKPSQIQLVSRDRKSGSLANNPRRSESLKPLDKSKLVSNSSLIDQSSIVGLGNDPEFFNLEFNEQTFQDLLQKAKIYKKSKITNEKKLNNEINELKNILGQKNQEILALKQQLLNRDRQSNNLQSQLNQLKRQKQNLNEQQNYNSIADNNISIDENDPYDNNLIPGADLTNNSIQYTTPMKEERQIPKKKLLPQSSNLKTKSKSPLQKQNITQPDSYTSRNLISNPSTNLPFSTSNNGSPAKKSGKKQIQLNPINQNNISQPQYSNYEPALNSNNKRYPQQKNSNHVSYPKQQQHSLQEIPNQNFKKSPNQKNLQKQPRQSEAQLARQSEINQSVEEFNSYSPTRFQNDEKNVPIQNNVLLSEQNLNLDDIITQQKGVSPQQQVLIPLTLRDVQVGVEIGDSYRFTDRITLKQNYHHKIVYVKVAHDEYGIIGIQCHYRLQKTTQIIEGEMHIISDQNSNIVLDDEQYVTEDFNADEKQDGDYMKYIQGTLNTETNQIVNLIFVTAKGYRKLLGLQQQSNYENLQSFNLDISENEVPICLYGSLQKQYGDNENPTGSILTLIGFNVERDDNQIEENIKAFYTEDDQVRTEFESNQKNQEMKKKINNNSTKFIRDENQNSQSDEKFQQNNSQFNIQHANQQQADQHAIHKNLDSSHQQQVNQQQADQAIQKNHEQSNLQQANKQQADVIHNNHEQSNQHQANQNSSYESPYFKSSDKKKQQTDQINPAVNQADNHQNNLQNNHKQGNSSSFNKEQIKLDANQHSAVENEEEEENEFTLSNMNIQNAEKKDQSESLNQKSHKGSSRNIQSQNPSRNSQHAQETKSNSNDVQKPESISRNSNTHKINEINNKDLSQDEQKKGNEINQLANNPGTDQDEKQSSNKQQDNSKNDQKASSSLSNSKNEDQISKEHQQQIIQEKNQKEQTQQNQQEKQIHKKEDQNNKEYEQNSHEKNQNQQNEQNHSEKQTHKKSEKDHQEMINNDESKKEFTDHQVLTKKQEMEDNHNDTNQKNHLQIKKDYDSDKEHNNNHNDKEHHQQNNLNVNNLNKSDNVNLKQNNLEHKDDSHSNQQETQNKKLERKKEENNQ